MAAASAHAQEFQGYQYQRPQVSYQWQQRSTGNQWQTSASAPRSQDPYNTVNVGQYIQQPPQEYAAQLSSPPQGPNNPGRFGNEEPARPLRQFARIGTPQGPNNPGQTANGPAAPRQPRNYVDQTCYNYCLRSAQIN